MKAVRCKSVVISSKWFHVSKNVFISMWEISPKGCKPSLKTEIVYLES